MNGSIKIAVCDYDTFCLQLVEQLLIEYSQLNGIMFQIKTFELGNDLINSTIAFDCYIMNVRLEDAFGLDLPKSLYKKNHEAKFIFISEYIEYAMDAFHVNAFRYILKPVEKKGFFLDLDSLMNRFDEGTVSFRDQNNVKRCIRKNEILYIDTYLRISCVHLVDKDIIAKVKITDWFDLLGDLFIHSYRGVIVNLKNIDFIDGCKIILKNNVILFSSKACGKVLKEKYYGYLDRLI